MNNPLNGHSRTIITRLLEAAIIGGVVMYGTVRINAGSIQGLKEDVTEIKEQINKIRDDFYVPRHRQQSSVVRHHPALAKMRGY
ncbi:MAG: hypothetical protein GTN99_06985 [Candidatus Dadabacteria bacterium]|nr:hypothetical protein [Candidatus Dadabacteria bacterium]